MPRRRCTRRVTRVVAGRWHASEGLVATAHTGRLVLLVRERCRTRAAGALPGHGHRRGGARGRCRRRRRWRRSGRSRPTRSRAREARWSRFRPTSELCRLNAAAGAPVVVSAEHVLADRARGRRVARHRRSLRPDRARRARGRWLRPRLRRGRAPDRRGRRRGDAPPVPGLRRRRARRRWCGRCASRRVSPSTSAGSARARRPTRCRRSCSTPRLSRRTGVLVNLGGDLRARGEAPRAARLGRRRRRPARHRAAPGCSRSARARSPPAPSCAGPGPR